MVDSSFYAVLFVMRRAEVVAPYTNLTLIIDEAYELSKK